MRAAGVTDKGVEEAIHVAFAFNVVTRIADALDFEVAAPKDGPKTAWILLNLGYETGTLPG